jgi:hypothetical protein
VSNGGGSFTVTATCSGPSTPFGNAWRLIDLGVNPTKTCTQWISNSGDLGSGTGVQAGCTPWMNQVAGVSFSWTSTGTCTLLPGHTYRLIHFVEKCHLAPWIAACSFADWFCFTMPQTSGIAPLPKGSKVQLEKTSNGVQMDATPEMMKGIK